MNAQSYGTPRIFAELAPRYEALWAGRVAPDVLRKAE